MRLGSPFFFWNEEVLQLADAPYREDSETFVPLQLLIDFVPRRISELYAFDGPTFTLQAADPADWGGTVVETLSPSEPQAPTGIEQNPAADPAASDGDQVVTPEYEGDRIVIIDPGPGYSRKWSP
jgi:hypothetical protein